MVLMMHGLMEEGMHVRGTERRRKVIRNGVWKEGRKNAWRKEIKKAGKSGGSEDIIQGGEDGGSQEESKRGRSVRMDGGSEECY